MSVGRGTNLAQLVTFGTATSIVIPSLLPTVDELVTLWFAVQTSFGDPNSDPTISTGTGLNFVKVIATAVGQSSTRTWLYRALKHSGLGSGTITINFGSLNIDWWQYVVDHWTGVDITGTDGSGAIGNTGMANQNNVGGDGPAIVTLPTFGSANNGTLELGWGYENNSNMSADPTGGSGYTDIWTGHTGSKLGYSLGWQVGNQTDCRITPNTGGGSPKMHEIGAELVAASGGGGGITQAMLDGSSQRGVGRGIGRGMARVLTTSWKRHGSGLFVPSCIDLIAQPAH